MRPYLAVIRDSFHEALVSRVLWILLLLTTLFLLALLPLGLIEQAGSVLREEDLLNQDKLIEKLLAQGKSTKPSPGRRIWELLDDQTKLSLERRGKAGGEPRWRFRLAEPLQKVMARRDFFVPADWADVQLSTAARALQKSGLADLPDDQVARFNRLALESAYPNEIAPIPPKQIQVAYFSWELGIPLPIEPEQLYPAINQLVVIALGYLLGVAGVFVAVLVTASMIPQTFEAGAVDLLLSKPVFRTWLFLAKFVGGCAFIAINAAYFIGGLWLILGVRFGLWNERLLLAIPLYLFLFAIYYAVSSLASIVWRNAIVSVVLAVVFWFVCWTLGTATNLVEQFSLNPRRFTAIVPAGDTLIAVNGEDVFRWDDSSTEWQKIFIGRADNQFPFRIPGRWAGPVYDPAGERIVAFKKAFPGFPLQAANRLLIGKRADDWRRTEGVNVPDGAYELLQSRQGDLLLASSQGIYRLEGNSEAKQPDINVFGLHIPLPQQGGGFVDVGPKLQLRPLQSAAIDSVSGAIALFDGHRLVVCLRDSDGTYRASKEIAFERKLTGEVALAGERVFLALGDGEIRRYDPQLNPAAPLSAPAKGLPETMATSSDGRYLAVIYRSGQLWVYDLREQKPLALPIVGQGSVASMAFEGPTLFVGDRVSRVTQYDLALLKIVKQWEGEMPLAEKIYRYALHPIYTIFPKPSQLNQTVTYLLTSADAPVVGVRINNNNNAAGPEKLDVWGPIWSNLAFLVVVLAVACVYIYRKDF
jgi:ABC-type transport system involved in multi-copper enzyme maturation permease subunit